MSALQKVIKYFAMAFAICLMVGIISGIIGIMSGISGGIQLNGDYEAISFTEEFESVKNLDFTCSNIDFIIQSGDTFVVEAKNVPDTFVAVLKSDGTLEIGYEKEINWFFNFGFFSMKDAEVIVTIPHDFKANKAVIDGGSASLDIESINANSLILDLGSGGTKITHMLAESGIIDGGSGDVIFERLELLEAIIDTGSGSFTIQKSNIENLDLDGGSGAVSIRGSLSGENKINAGSGNVTISINDSINNFSLDGDAGSGGIWIDNKKVDDFTRDNKSAMNSIEIDGGSGRIAIDFIN